MEKIEQWLREELQNQLKLLQHDKRCGSIEWSIFGPVLVNTLLPQIATLVKQLLQEKEELITQLEWSNKQLSTKIRFSNTHDRDIHILTLHKQGLSRRKIAKE